MCTTLGLRLSLRVCAGAAAAAFDGDDELELLEEPLDEDHPGDCRPGSLLLPLLLLTMLPWFATL